MNKSMNLKDQKNKNFLNISNNTNTILDLIKIEN